MKTVLLFLMSVCLVVAEGQDLRDFFPLCQSEPDLETCFLQALLSAQPRIKYGIKDIGVPPLDPYILDKLDIDAVVPYLKIKCTATNIRADGASNYEIPYLRIDNRTNAFEMKIVLPFVTVVADYDTRGTTVFFVKLEGHGKFKGTFNEITTIVKGLLKPIIKDDAEVLSVESLSTEINFGDSDLNVTPLKSSLATRAAVVYIKARPTAIMESVAPLIEEYIAPRVRVYINSLLETKYMLKNK